MQNSADRLLTAIHDSQMHRLLAVRTSKLDELEALPVERRFG